MMQLTQLEQGARLYCEDGGVCQLLDVLGLRPRDGSNSDSVSEAPTSCSNGWWGGFCVSPGSEPQLFTWAGIKPCPNMEGMLLGDLMDSFDSFSSSEGPTCVSPRPTTRARAMSVDSDTDKDSATWLYSKTIVLWSLRVLQHLISRCGTGARAMQDVVKDGVSVPLFRPQSPPPPPPEPPLVSPPLSSGRWPKAVDAIRWPVTASHRLARYFWTTCAYHNCWCIPGFLPRVT